MRRYTGLICHPEQFCVLPACACQRLPILRTFARASLHFPPWSPQSRPFSCLHASLLMAGLAIASRHSALPTLLGINPPLLVLCPSHPKLLNVAPHLTLEEQPYPLLLAVGWTLEPLLLYRTSRFWLSNLAPLLTLGDNLPSPLCRWLTLCLFSNSTSLPIGSSPYFGRNRILPSKRLVEPFFFIELYLSDCWDWILVSLWGRSRPPLLAVGWTRPALSNFTSRLFNFAPLLTSGAILPSLLGS